MFNQNKPANNLFGNNPPQQPQGNLFGANTTTGMQPPANNLFGANKPATGTGLFGATTPQNTQPQQGGFFGATNPQPTAGTGLFGATGAQNPPQNTFLGGNTTQPQNTGLFGGQPQQPQQPQQQGLFNRGPTTTGTGFFNPGTTNPPAVGTGLFNPGGNTIFGAQNPPQTGSLLPNSFNQPNANMSPLGGFPMNQNAQLNEAKIFELMNAPLDQQKKLI